MAVPTDRNLVQSVLRACDILSCFTSATPELSLQELSRSTGLNRTTTHRIAATLRHAGFLVLTEPGRYRLGQPLFQLGAIVAESMDLRRAGRDLMVGLATATGDTVFLLVAEGREAMCIDRVHGETDVTLNLMPVGGTLPLHVSAGAAVLLAHREDELLPQLTEHELTAYTDRTVTDPAALAKRSQLIRTRGYSFADGDVIPGIAGFGAPVHDRSDQVVAALSVGGLSHRFHGGRGEEVRSLLVQAASELSRRLGSSRSRSAAGPARGRSEEEAG